MRINKSKAFVYSLLTLILFFILTLSVVPDMVGVIGNGIIAGVVGITLTFIGGNVADNGVKGAFFNEALNKEGK